MKEFIEKLIGRLEELKTDAIDKWDGGASHRAYSKSIEIVNQLVREYKNNDSKTDYDSIIEFIESEIERTRTYSEHETQIKIMYFVKELKEKSETVCNPKRLGGWISCKERLPERNKPVLCWVRSTTIASGETFIIGSCDHECWFLQTYEIGHHHFPVKDYEVVAWQPLPTPYKESEEK